MNSAVLDCMERRQRPLLGLAQLLFAVVALATACMASGANLSEIYQQALDNDPVLAGARAGAAARQETIALARSALLPQANASAGASKTTVFVDGTDTNGQPFPERNVERRNWGVGVTQTVLNVPGWYRYRGALASAKQADWELQTASQALITRVAEAYLNVLRGEAALESVAAAEEAVRRQLEQVQQRFDVGLVAITDVLEAKAEYDNAVVNRIQAEGDHDIYFEGLRVLTANPVDAIDPLSATLPIVDPDPADEEQWVGTALASNSRLEAVRHALTAAQRGLKGQLAGHLPSISASVNYGASTGSQAFGGFVTPSQPSGSLTYSLNVNMPIFQGLRTYASVRQARHNLNQARQQLIAQELTVDRETRTLYRAVMTEVVRVAARKEAIKSSQAALEATQTGYEVGTRNIVDVLLAQRRLFSSQFAYANSRYDYVIKLLRLKESAGVLNQEDVVELSQHSDSANPIRPFSTR